MSVKIMVVGGSGFIGSWLIESLLARGDEVVNVDIAFKKETDSLRDKAASSLYSVAKCDITNADYLTKVVSDSAPRAVVHLAALTGVRACDTKPREAFDVNTYGTFNVAHSCAAVGAKLIFASSREVYGETTGGKTFEDDGTVPNNIYGITKLLAEEIIRRIATKMKLRYTILRFTNVYGPGGDKYGIQVLIKKVLSQEKPQLYGGDQTMNFLYVNDTVNAIMTCLENRLADGQTFNAGSESNTTIEDALHRIAKLAGGHVEWEALPRGPNETYRFEPALEKIQEILHWRAKVDFNDGLARTFEWYKNRIESIAAAK